MGNFWQDGRGTYHIVQLSDHSRLEISVLTLPSAINFEMDSDFVSSLDVGTLGFLIVLLCERCNEYDIIFHKIFTVKVTVMSPRILSSSWSHGHGHGHSTQSHSHQCHTQLFSCAANFQFTCLYLLEYKAEVTPHVTVTSGSPEPRDMFVSVGIQRLLFLAIGPWIRYTGCSAMLLPHGCSVSNSVFSPYHLSRFSCLHLLGHPHHQTPVQSFCLFRKDWRTSPSPGPVKLAF
jgi:hypothetical protein